MNDKKQEIDHIMAQLKDPRTIREKAHLMLDKAKKNQLKYFAVDPHKMASTADYVIEVIHDCYPDLNIPYHSRWRHFEVDDMDRVKEMLIQLKHLSPFNKGKILYELVIISVFLDAGAGASWRYREERTGREYSRSEGLALASFDLYQSGAFSSDPTDPFRVDAKRLLSFNTEELCKGFQITSANPLEGITGRLKLLNQLGKILLEQPEYFGQEGRLGNFYSYVYSLAHHNKMSATSIFSAVLNAFNTIWPARLLFHGISLGDVWIHSALKTNESGSEYIPFHKLSQWLTYSLIEPLEQAGIKIVDLDQLTGLPEYRNGGLLIDTNLLIVKNKEALLTPLDPGSEIIVEWRALTVALLDELAELIRKKLNQNSESFPLAKMLQGGTWEAGRRIAKEKRLMGTPPIQIISDGTVF